VFFWWGGSSPDYDPAFRFPIFVMTLDSDYQHWDGSQIEGIQDVFNGRFLDSLSYWCTPIKERIRRNKQERFADLKSAAEDIGGELADELWHHSQKTSETRPMLSYKHSRDQIAKQDMKINTADQHLERLFEIPE
jgi:hypothetical protein